MLLLNEEQNELPEIDTKILMKIGEKCTLKDVFSVDEILHC
jgi:hypothetical protein